jgi:hypothetical protein
VENEETPPRRKLYWNEAELYIGENICTWVGEKTCNRI